MTSILAGGSSRSPSPHGRVGTDMRISALFSPALVTVPSWSGRNINAEPFRGGKVNMSPSPHGRVGTQRWLVPMLQFLSMVTVPSWSGRNGASTRKVGQKRRSHRPLMVGSEPSCNRLSLSAVSKVAVPSWSGRNGQPQRCRVAWRAVAVPSWSGRNHPITPSSLTLIIVAVPSWSGRNPGRQ